MKGVRNLAFFIIKAFWRTLMWCWFWDFVFIISGYILKSVHSTISRGLWSLFQSVTQSETGTEGMHLNLQIPVPKPRSSLLRKHGLNFSAIQNQGNKPTPKPRTVKPSYPQVSTKMDAIPTPRPRPDKIIKNYSVLRKPKPRLSNPIQPRIFIVGLILTCSLIDTTCKYENNIVSSGNTPLKLLLKASSPGFVTGHEFQNYVSVLDYEACSYPQYEELAYWMVQRPNFILRESRDLQLKLESKARLEKRAVLEILKQSNETMSLRPRVISNWWETKKINLRRFQQELLKQRRTFEPFSTWVTFLLGGNSKFSKYICEENQEKDFKETPVHVGEFMEINLEEKIPEIRKSVLAISVIVGVGLITTSAYLIQEYNPATG